MRSACGAPCRWLKVLCAEVCILRLYPLPHIYTLFVSFAPHLHLVSHTCTLVSSVSPVSVTWVCLFHLSEPRCFSRVCRVALERACSRCFLAALFAACTRCCTCSPLSHSQQAPPAAALVLHRLLPLKSFVVCLLSLYVYRERGRERPGVCVEREVGSGR